MSGFKLKNFINNAENQKIKHESKSKKDSNDGIENDDINIFKESDFNDNIENDDINIFKESDFNNLKEINYFNDENLFNLDDYEKYQNNETNSEVDINNNLEESAFDFNNFKWGNKEEEENNKENNKEDNKEEEEIKWGEGEDLVLDNNNKEDNKEEEEIKWGEGEDLFLDNNNNDDNNNDNNYNDNNNNNNDNNNNDNDNNNNDNNNNDNNNNNNNDNNNDNNDNNNNILLLNERIKNIVKKLKKIKDVDILNKVENILEKDYNENSENNKYNGGSENNPVNEVENIGLIPGECSYFTKQKKNCMKNLLNNIKDKLEDDKLIEAKEEEDELIESLKENLNCDTEKCVGQKLKNKGYTDDNILLYFKPTGPIDTKLFSNVNIDNVLNHFEIAYPFFFHINFLMNDWWNAPSNHEIHDLVNNNNNKMCSLYNANDLETDNINNNNNNNIDKILNKIKETKKKCYGCVFNIDYYSGMGTHWVAMFIDLRDSKKPTIEYYNSSGNKPPKNFIKLMTKLKEKLEGCMPTSIEIVQVTNEEVQQDDFSCGPHSVYYIYQRLKGIPYKFFNGIDYEYVKDDIATMFRKYIFYTADKH